MKPLLTFDKLSNAQQEAIEIYQTHRRIGEKDVYAILHLNTHLANSDHYLEDHATYGDIRRFVDDIANEYFEVQSSPFGDYRFKLLPDSAAYNEIKGNWLRDRLSKQVNCKTDWDRLDKDTPFHYEHTTMPIAKLNLQAQDILSGTTLTVQLNDSVSSFLEKNFNVKEKKCMWNYDEQGNLLKEAEQKLNKILNEKGRLIRKDVWDALGITMANSRDFGQQVLMEKAEGNGLNRRTKEAIELTFDQVYLPYKLPRGLSPVKMWQTDNGYTTIQWSDSTTTSVKTENEGQATPYGGFCACVLKKLYGSTGQAIKLMQRADKNAKLPAEKKRIEREALKKFRQARAEIQRNEEAKRHEHMVKLQMEEIYAKREAERRVAEADARKEEVK